MFVLFFSYVVSYLQVGFVDSHLSEKNWEKQYHAQSATNIGGGKEPNASLRCNSILQSTAYRAKAPQITVIGRAKIRRPNTIAVDVTSLPNAKEESHCFRVGVSFHFVGVYDVLVIRMTYPMVRLDTYRRSPLSKS